VSIIFGRPFDLKLQLLNSINKLRYRIQEPVKNQRCSNQKCVALALNSGLLVAHILRWRAGIEGLTRGHRFIFPVDVHDQEEANWQY
jgi:hypothetical protein